MCDKEYMPGFYERAFAGCSQVLGVTAADTTQTSGLLTAFETRDDNWHAVFTAPVFLGRHGMVNDAQHREGCQQTPVGVYDLPYAFGWLPNPGTSMPYIRTTADDYFDENSGSPTYNRMVRGNPGGNAESMAIPPYCYGILIDFNPDQIPYKGSGIFLHVRGDHPYTQGCIAMETDQIVRLLRWLDPAKHPRILICPQSEWSKYYI